MFRGRKSSLVICDNVFDNEGTILIKERP